MRSDSTMRTKDAMTILLVVTLLTNLARHELGTVSASDYAEKRLDSKRRQLERLLRLGLTTNNNSNIQESSGQLRPAEESIGTRSYPPGKISLKWFQLNHLPDRDSPQRDVGLLWQPNNDSLPRDNWVKGPTGANLVYSDSLPTSGAMREMEIQLLKELELSSDKDNSQYRRHAQLPLSQAQTKAERRKEREQKREEKKKKRNKDKKKFRQENKRMLELIENEGAVLHNIEGEDYFDCCPSKLVVVEKQVGKDRNNHAVEVRHSQQYFYERICLPSIEGAECIFPSKSLKKGVLTRCAQQFSYVQAQVRPYRSDQEWQLDYIHVRSGCSCQVSATPRRKKKKGKRR